MNALTWTFLTMLGLSIAIEVWLSRRQIRHVLAHREEVPAAFRDRVSGEEHRKAADYTAARNRFGLISLAVGTALLLGWTLGGGIDLLDRIWRGLLDNGMTAGIALLLSTMLAMTLLDLPLGIWRTFVLEERFGFNRTTPRLFAIDALKGLLLALVLLTPLAWVALWLMESAGTAWWLYLWAVWIAFQLLLVWAYPTLIAPLFNRFSPLDNPELQSRIEGLLTRCGFESRGVFVMDGSRRSSHGNAYFTGLGRSKRIVFFDTLIERLDGEEIEGVLAHELGHFKHRHVTKRLISGAMISLAGLALLGWLSAQTWFYTGLGVSTPSPAAALLLFSLALPPFTTLLTPIGAWLSRRHEFQADAYAASHADAGALIRALVKLTRDNASTLTPDPLHSAFHDSHPPAPVRIDALQRLQAEAP